MQKWQYEVEQGRRKETLDRSLMWTASEDRKKTPVLRSKRKLKMQIWIRLCSQSNYRIRVHSLAKAQSRITTITQSSLKGTLTSTKILTLDRTILRISHPPMLSILSAASASIGWHTLTFMVSALTL
jgi:hypothetical protein